MQALREKRAAEQPGKKKRKRADEDEDASTADEMSDSDDAVGRFLAIRSPAHLYPAPRALCTSFCGATAFPCSCSLHPSVYIKIFPLPKITVQVIILTARTQGKSHLLHAW